MTVSRISLDVFGELSEAQINHFRELLNRQLEQMDLRGEVTTPPRFELQQNPDPGDLRVRLHLSRDPIDRDDSCRIVYAVRTDSWIFTPAELLDMMANPRRVFPIACERCTSGHGSALKRLLRRHEPGLWPDDATRASIVSELRDQFRELGWC